MALTPDVANLDHIMPIAKGGNNVIENLQVVHCIINRMKGTLTNREFITWCRLVASHADIMNGSLDGHDA